MTVYKRTATGIFEILNHMFFVGDIIYVSDSFRLRLSIDLVKIFTANGTYLGYITKDAWYKLRDVTEQID